MCIVKFFSIANLKPNLHDWVRRGLSELVAQNFDKGHTRGSVQNPILKKCMFSKPLFLVQMCLSKNFSRKFSRKATRGNICPFRMVKYEHLSLLKAFHHATLFRRDTFPTRHFSDSLNFSKSLATHFRHDIFPTICRKSVVSEKCRVGKVSYRKSVVTPGGFLGRGGSMGRSLPFYP